MHSRRWLLGLALSCMLGPACRPPEDNGGDPNVTLTAPTAPLTTRERGGGTLDFRLELGSRPTHAVTVTVTSSAVDEGTATPNAVTFEPSGWRSAQTLSVSGVSDGTADGDQPYTLTFAVESGDADYNGFALPTPTFDVTSIDDDLLQASPASPAGFDFGSLATDSVSDVMAWTIQNVSTTTATSHLNDVTAGGDFVVVHNGCGNADYVTGLAPGASCALYVRFTPSSVGTQNHTLQLTASAGGTVSAALTGVGTARTTLTVWPRTHHFEEAEIGQPVARTFNVYNGTVTALTNLAITPADADVVITPGATDPCGVAMTSGEVCSFVATFTPAGPAGFASRMISVTADPSRATTVGISAVVVP